MSVRYAEGGQDGPDAILMSPWPESVYAFEPAWQNLAAAAHVVAIDPPGFGGSDYRQTLMNPKAMKRPANQLRGVKTMRPIFVGIIALAASLAVAHGAQAQHRGQRLPAYVQMQARPIHREPKEDLQPMQDDLRNVQRNNRDLELPSSRDDVVGDDQVHSDEEAETTRIEQDSVRIDREIRNICPSC